MRQFLRPVFTLLAVTACLHGTGAEKGGRPKDVFPWAGELPVYQPATKVSGTLHSVGADTMDEITFGWIRGFRQLHPDVVMTMEARGSLTAAPALTSGLADVSPVAREFLPSELSAFEQRFGYKPTAIRVAGGSYATKGRTHALSIIVHRENPITQITFAQLDAIYSASRRRGGAEILTWGQLGLKGEWADRPVVPYGLRRPNGIVNFFQSRVMLGGDFKTGVRERESPRYIEEFEPVAQSVAADLSGIAYADFAPHTDGVKAIAVSASPDGPFVEGTFANVLNQSYPLARTLNIYVNRPPGQPMDPKVREFLRFVLSREGQRIVAAADSNFLPLPPQIVREELAKLESSAGGAAGANHAAPRGRD